MTSENQVLKYKSEGLPGDTLSLENSAAILHSYQCSLIIDPNYQATQWLISNLVNAEELV
jgi:dynein heavy chain 2